jgi:hypothetical protein
MEIQASELFSDLGFALRSPADGGERILGPDCFFTLRSRVLFVKLEVLFVILGMSCAVDARGPLCNLYPLFK